MLSTQVVPCIAHGEKDMKNAEAVETGSPNLGLDPSNHTRKRPADSHPAAVAVTASDCSIESATSEYRMTAWDSLLDERPPRDSPEKMSAWLMSVLAVSDLDVPVDTENMIPEAIYNLQDGEQQMNQVISIASVLHLEKKDSVKRQTKFHKPEDGR